MSAPTQQVNAGLVAKEKDAHNAATPRKVRKESSVPRPSQDAELRDYVRFRAHQPVQAIAPADVV